MYGKLFPKINFEIEFQTFSIKRIKIGHRYIFSKSFEFPKLSVLELKLGLRKSFLRPRKLLMKDENSSNSHKYQHCHQENRK
jgi:hypothetical protein